MYSIFFYLYFLITTPIYFTIGFVLLLLTGLFDRERKVLHYYSYFWGLQHYFVSPWWKIEVIGLENVVPKKKYIIMSNHQSMLDICLLYKVPKIFKWISKKEVVKIPFVGWALWLHRDVLINRGDLSGLKKMLHESQAYLKHNISIILFPEGTRTKDGKMHEFKEGGFLLAKASKTAILPVVINGNFDLQKRNSWKLKRKQKFSVKILPEISENEVATTSTKEMMNKVHELMRTTHQQLAPEKYEKKQPPFGVIFDMDGVLVNNHEYHRKAFVELLRQFQVENPENKFNTSIYGKRNTDILRTMFPNESHETLLRFSVEKEALYRKIYQPHVQAMKGLLPLLETLKEKKIPIAIGSSAMIENVNFIIDELKIRNYFSTIIHETMVQEGKPNPEVFLKAAKDMNLKPENCIVFEDSIPGVMAGKTAGAKVIGVLTAHTADELKSYTNATINDFEEITIEKLEKLFQ